MSAAAGTSLSPPAEDQSEATTSGARSGSGWQKQKSQLARQSILSASVKCLADVGYADLTLNLIAERAGLSRGAVQYYFSSKNDVIEETIKYIFDEQLKLQKVYARRANEPISYDLHRRRIETLWGYMRTPLLIAYLQIAVSSRNNPALKATVRRAYQNFIEQERKQSLKSLPEWQADMAKFEFAANIVSTMLEGMAMRQMFGQSTEVQDRPIRDHLAQIVDSLFQASTSA